MSGSVDECRGVSGSVGECRGVSGDNFYDSNHYFRGRKSCLPTLKVVASLNRAEQIISNI